MRQKHWSSKNKNHTPLVSSQCLTHPVSAWPHLVAALFALRYFNLGVSLGSPPAPPPPALPQRDASSPPSIIDTPFKLVANPLLPLLPPPLTIVGGILPGWLPSSDPEQFPSKEASGRVREVNLIVSGTPSSTHTHTELPTKATTTIHSCCDRLNNSGRRNGKPRLPCCLQDRHFRLLTLCPSRRDRLPGPVFTRHPSYVTGRSSSITNTAGAGAIVRRRRERRARVLGRQGDTPAKIKTTNDQRDNAHDDVLLPFGSRAIAAPRVQHVATGVFVAVLFLSAMLNIVRHRIAQHMRGIISPRPQMRQPSWKVGKQTTLYTHMI